MEMYVYPTLKKNVMMGTMKIVFIVKNMMNFMMIMMNHASVQIKVRHAQPVSSANLEQFVLLFQKKMRLFARH